MAQRNSGHARIARDAYMTPVWVTDVLTCEIVGTLLPKGSVVWEPAAGTCQMVAALERSGLRVVPFDIAPSSDNVLAADFLGPDVLPFEHAAIITNPPYKQAEEFVRRALAFEQPANNRGLVAMLLSADFDSAKTRRDLFDEHPAWGLKIVLCDRITWFDPKPGDPSPSANHAWYVWDWKGRAGRSTRYGYAPAEVLADLARKRAKPKSRMAKARARKRNCALGAVEPAAMSPSSIAVLISARIPSSARAAMCAAAPVSSRSGRRT